MNRIIKTKLQLLLIMFYSYYKNIFYMFLYEYIPIGYYISIQKLTYFFVLPFLGKIFVIVGNIYIYILYKLYNIIVLYFSEFYFF